MKKIILASAAIAALATPTLAVDLGRGWALNNTVTLEYFVEAEDAVATYEAELTYSVNDQLSLYAYTEIDLEDIDFVGLDLGATYNPAQLEIAEFNIEAQFDNDLEYQELVLSAELQF